MKKKASKKPVIKVIPITVTSIKEKACLEEALSILDKNGYTICKKDSLVLENGMTFTKIQ